MIMMTVIVRMNYKNETECLDVNLVERDKCAHLTITVMKSGDHSKAEKSLAS
jgi:hypothetical protein